MEYNHPPTNVIQQHLGSNQIGESVLSNFNQQQVFQTGQQRVPTKYYQNIKNQLDEATNQLDQAKIYNIQWSEAY